MTGALLDVTNLRVEFATPTGPLQAVRGASFSVRRGEVLGVVGESGSGKTVSLLAVMGLLPATATVTGSALYRGAELIGRPDKELARLRGEAIAMVFQDPMTSLNPVRTVGRQIAEAVRVHHATRAKAAAQRAIELLDLVGIPNPPERAGQYPHEFSGGMRQRAMIAMAIANEPEILFADEPTTALDVTVQAQILEVLQKAQQETGSAIVLVSHNLGLVAGIADRVQVMYAGEVVESGPVFDLFARPRHPYTRALLASLPRLDAADGRTLDAIPGHPPNLLRPPPGCAFHPRCPRAEDVCAVEHPALRSVGAQSSRCHFSPDAGRA